MPAKIRLTYILSNINKALAFEWIAEKLDQDPFQLSFILLNPGNSALEEVLVKKKILFTRIQYRSKKDLPRAIYQIYDFLKKNESQVVHCHLFDASLAGLLAAKMAGVPKRIFTRHYATFHHQYFPRAVWYDRFTNSLATNIIAISENVRNVLIDKEKVKPQKITLIHHGFELSDFTEPLLENINVLKNKYLPSKAFPIVGVISRYFELKGLQYVIPAFKELLETYPEAHLLLANATGSYKAEIQNLLQAIPKENYTEIPFEADLFSLYQLFNVFVHVPINPEIEAFGQTYVEALAAGIPSVFSLSGVAAEFIEHEKNALVVPFQNSEAIHQAMVRIIEDEALRKKLIQNGRESVQEKFGLDVMIQKLETLYGK